jgi:ArsR family metal-binding transcriptional regulator
VWVITVYADQDVKMYEFDDEHEAKEALEKLENCSCKILSQVIYYNDEFIVEKAAV